MQDTELIITNTEQEQEVQQQPTPPDTSQSSPTDSAGGDKEPMPTTREILSKVTEEDTPMVAGVTLLKILGGEFFNTGLIRRQIGVVLLIACFTVFYIANRYSCQNSLLEIDKLNQELIDAKYKALSTSSELTERSRESHVLEVLKACGDSTIHVNDQPPYLIKVPQQ